MELDNHQIIAKNWLLIHNRGILADEPGVGKTLPAIEAAKEFPLVEHVLVICPAYLRRNWFREIVDSGVPWVNITLVDGDSTKKRFDITEFNLWTIISYETYRRQPYIGLLKDNSYDLFIFDESHHIRNRKSMNYHAAELLAKSNKPMWFLTGTPTVANGGDVYTTLHLIDPKTFKSYWRFVKEHCHLNETPWTTEVKGLIDRVRFEKMLAPYMLRRLYYDVYPDNPEYIEKHVYIDLKQSTYANLKEMKKAFREKLSNNTENMLLSAGALVHALRRTIIDDDSKFRVCLDIIEEHKEKSFVIFCWYRETGVKLKKYLEKKEIISEVITGDVSSSNRDSILKLHKDNYIPILIATLSTMQEGVNLQYCHNVIFVESDWLEKTHIQAIGRLIRRGQKSIVNVWNLLGYKTIDETIHKTRLSRKEMNLRELLPEIIGEKENA